MVQGLGVLKNKQSKTIRKSGPNTSKKGLVRADPKKKSLIKSHQMKKKLTAAINRSIEETMCQRASSTGKLTIMKSVAKIAAQKSVDGAKK